MTTTLQESQTHTNRSTGRLKVGLAFMAFILIGANDGAFGVLLPSVQAHYHIDKSTVGLLFLASVVGYFAASFNTGLLVEKLGNRLFLVVSTMIYALGAGFISLMPPFLFAPFAYLFIGFGIAMMDAGLNAYIAGLPKNTALLNYLHAFYGVGAWLGPVAASSILAIQFGWNAVYWLWGGLSLLLLFSFAAFFRKQITSGQAVAKSESNLMTSTLKLRVVWLAAFFLLFYVGAEVSLGSWSYSFLTEERHGLPLLSGWIVSGYWLGLTLGRATLGKVAQMVGNKRMIQGCLAGVVVGIVLTWLAPNQVVAAIGLWLTGFSLGPIFPTTIALMSTLVTGRVLPSAIGFLASLGSAGAALFPWLAGNLAEHLGLWSLFPYVIVLTIVMLALWITLQRQPTATAEQIS